MLSDNFLTDDTGMSTVEYAIGLIGAAAIAALLIVLAKDESVMEALRALFDRALAVP